MNDKKPPHTREIYIAKKKMIWQAKNIFGGEDSHKYKIQKFSKLGKDFYWQGI